MTVRVERVVEVPAALASVWELVSDPAFRASAISVVKDFEANADGTATWHVSLPIPVIDRTIAVETEERTRDPPRYVEFVGRSRAMHVRGEHELEETNGGTRLTSRFTVEGRLPGVERFFEGRLDDELDNLEAALSANLDTDGGDTP